MSKVFFDSKSKEILVQNSDFNGSYSNQAEVDATLTKLNTLTTELNNYKSQLPVS